MQPCRDLGAAKGGRTLIVLIPHWPIPDYQVDLDAIALGEKIGATMILTMLAA